MREISIENPLKLSKPSSGMRLKNFWTPMENPNFLLIFRTFRFRKKIFLSISKPRLPRMNLLFLAKIFIKKFYKAYPKIMILIEEI